MKLDTERLKNELPNERWFGDKDREVAQIEVLDVGVLDDGDETLALTLLRVRFMSGPDGLYGVPLLVSPDGYARDAFHDIERLRTVGEILAGGVPIKGENGGVFHFSGPSLNPSAPPGNSSVRAIGAEQSNTSVVFDEEVILKFFRKLEVGPNPDLELTRLLTNEGFPSIPHQLGEIFYRGEEVDFSPQAQPVAELEERTIDLGIAQQFISESKEGWAYVLSAVGTLIDEADTGGSTNNIIAALEDRGADLLDAIDQLGEATAELHVELSREDLDTDFLAEPVTADDLIEWSMSAIDRMNALVGQVPELKPLSAGLAERLRAVTTIQDAGAKTRTHGDYHLAQVLRVPRGWRILDFEGEPARSLAQRRAKRSPLKDTAGMLRSFSYVGTAVLFDRAEPDTDRWLELESWTLEWEALARERFIASYLATSHEGRFMPGDREAFSAILDFFELDKALYEMSYERSHRPDWLRIPLRGIRQLLERSDRT